MSLKTFVKIGKINNLSDARYCAGMMVDILGFNLEEGTDGYVNPEMFKEISEWLAGVDFCGEFSNAQPAEIKLATTSYNIQFIEVQDVAILEELSELDVKLILKYTIDSQSDLERLDAHLELAQDYVEHVIIYTTKPELSNEIQMKVAALKDDLSIIRGYDLSVANAPEIAEGSTFSGIELEGSPEDRPGFKDYGVVMDILEVLEED
jgi:phosphoribosylanthranilate isomerase